MEPTQSAISFDFANLLDLNRWSVELGCYFLTVYKRNFSTKEVEYLKREITSHEKKSPESSFNFMQAFAKEIIEGKSVIEDVSAFIEFTRIYRIAATKFNINESVTPYQFIGWAINKRTIPVHEELLQWREEERDKSPTGRTSAIRREIKKAQARIAELETELAACREQMEEARRANTSGNGDTEGFFEAYPICKLIYGLHHAGKSRDEIRAALTAKGYSNAQTGFLTQGDTLARSDKTIKQSVLRSKKDAKCS